jgi:hypothetical protein
LLAFKTLITFRDCGGHVAAKVSLLLLRVVDVSTVDPFPEAARKLRHRNSDAPSAHVTLVNQSKTPCRNVLNFIGRADSTKKL